MRFWMHVCGVKNQKGRQNQIWKVPTGFWFVPTRAMTRLTRTAVAYRPTQL